MQWLVKAAQDLSLAQHLLSEEGTYDEAICFHAQQAAEKYLKAFLTWHQVEFPKTHDVGRLARLAGSVEPLLTEALREVTILSAYAVELRYPDELLHVSHEHAESAVQMAAAVRELIESRLRPILQNESSPSG